MVEETAAGADAPVTPAPAPLLPATVLGGRCALVLGAVLLLLLGTVEAVHWQTLSRPEGAEQVVQIPAPVTTPATHPDVSAWDPGDNP
jgi:hypothetical protein